ncbi:DUF1049 domain-containing protein [Pseudomonas sp. ODNR1LW]|nr:DUF1049 domain-containing protein [Pseudomonas sp. ODNR1LW]
MRGLKRLSLLLIVSVAVVVTLLFSLENQQPVSLAFFGWATPQWSVSVYILGALLLGLMVGPLLGVVIHRRKRHSPLK